MRRKGASCCRPKSQTRPMKRLSFKPRVIRGRQYTPYGHHKTKKAAQSEATKLRKWPSLSGVAIREKKTGGFSVNVRLKPRK